MSPPSAEPVALPYAAVEAAWRAEWPQLVAVLTRMVGDIDLAEDLAQDALVAAVQQWPRDGIPPRPGAWLTVTAEHRARDRMRLDRTLALALEVEVEVEVEDEDAPVIEDDLLRMAFVACHPDLPQSARVALTLRLVGGLTVEEIARAYVVPPATIAQRIVRAKHTISTRDIPFAVPAGAELDHRLDSVLDVICLIFTGGYAASADDDLPRIDLAEEGMRLARMLAVLLPEQPETHALAALLQLQGSRLGARTTPDLPLVLLDDQDRARWDQLLVRRGIHALQRAHALNREAGLPPGRYALQAAIAAEHAIARTPERTDWTRLTRLYTMLYDRFPSPIVQLKRAVAVAMADGPQAGLVVVDAIAATGRLDGYQLLPAVRGGLLARLGREDEAAAEFDRAAVLATNNAVRRLLSSRAHGLRNGEPQKGDLR